MANDDIVQYAIFAGGAGFSGLVYKTMAKINNSAEKSYDAQLKRQAKEIEDQDRKIEHQEQEIQTLRKECNQIQGDLMALVRVIRDSDIEISSSMLREDTAKRLGLS